MRNGLNLTVRNGTKWADLIPGSELVIRKTGVEHIDITSAIAIAAQTVNLEADESLEEAALAFEHDDTCRTIEGLRAAMIAAYPEGYGPTLTLVWFYV